MTPGVSILTSGQNMDYQQGVRRGRGKTKESPDERDKEEAIMVTASGAEQGKDRPPLAGQQVPYVKRRLTLGS